MSLPSENGELRDGLVIAGHGRNVIVEADGARVQCKILGRKLEIVCGDEVRWQTESTGRGGVVMERLPRRCALVRTDGVGRAETIVANITQLLITTAPEPVTDFFIVDRYLAAAELLEISSALLLNKVDRGSPELQDCRQELALYAQLGYPVLECSAALGLGIDTLRIQLRGHKTILVGQSGAGKSSLANALLPDLNAATSSLSRATAEGRHTTSASSLHHLPGGGDLIDSPGVRDFAPAIEWLNDPARGFREISTTAAGCRFQDCRHMREPGCAVQAAVDSGSIAPRRYESYRRLLRLKEDLAPDPGRKRGLPR